MSSYPNLPGIQVYTIDRGLASRTVPKDKSVLICGTAGQGPQNDPFQVTDRAAAASTFGLNGSLIKAMEEVAANCDNVILYRIGTGPTYLNGVGAAQIGPITAVSQSVGGTCVYTGTFTGAATNALSGGSITVSGMTPSALNGTFTCTASSAVALTLSNAAVTTAASGLTGMATYSGFNIECGSTNTDNSTDYQIWYKAGILYVWFYGDLVFSNDAANGYSINTGDITITGNILNLGLELGTGTSAQAVTTAQALTLTQAGALTGSTAAPAPVFVLGADGTSLTLRQTYVALAQALDLLMDFSVDSVYCPDAFVDAPNVAYRMTAAGNTSVLDWLKTTSSSTGVKTYQWASESVDSNGTVATPMAGSITTAAARVAAGWHEVHFEYLLANFCYVQETIGQSGTCIGFIGTTGPNSFSLIDTRNWIGYLPQYSPVVTNEVITAGNGILGIPTIVGTVPSNLSVLCTDSSIGRAGGLFATTVGEYDGIVVQDANGNNVDIGAYIHVFADQGVISNGYATNYCTNLAGYVAGIASALDEKSNLTNKPVNAVQLWKASFAQMDSLTWAGVNVLRFKGNGILPVMLHGFTIATDLSDYHNLLRQRIKGLVVDTIRVTADPYIGESSTDGLQLTAMQTALDSALTNLQKRGYISRYSFVVSVTQAEQRIGHANIYVNFYPADELVQLTATVGISRS